MCCLVEDVMKWYLFLSQVLIAARLGLSSSALQEEACSIISTHLHQQKEQASACQVPKHLQTGSREDLFSYAVFQHHHTSLSDDVLTWHKWCVPFGGIHALLGVNHRNGSRTTRDSSIPTRSIDYLFLVEKPSGLYNSSAAEALLNSIRLLVEATRERSVFHDVWTQFGFIVYTRAHTEKLKYVYARDFSSEFSSELYTHLLPEPSLDEGREDVSTSPRGVALGYRAVVDSLRVLGRCLRLVSKEGKFHQRVTLSDNRSLHLWHRPYSDLHLMSVIDVGTEYSSNEEDGGKKLHQLKRETEHTLTKLADKLVPLSTSPLTLHSFFHTSNEAALSELGQPEVSVRYPDCSHFRKAPTLKALIAGGNGHTLQALLLSKGVEYQLHHWQDLEDVRCMLGISPALSTPLGVRPDFPPNPCWIRGQEEEEEGVEGWYCSSLHGWTERGGVSGIKLLQDRVPLAGEYSPSHADIALSARSSEPSGEEHVPIVEELSISKASGGGEAGTRSRVVVGEPPSVQWSHDRPFIEDIIERGEAVVLLGTVVDTWPALRKWDMPYLSQNMGTDLLEFVKCTDNFLTFDPDRRAALKLEIPLSYALANLSTADFFRCVQSNATCPSDGYRGHYYFGSVPSSLRADVSPDTLLYRTERDRKAAKQFMWISSPGMITHAHFDQDHNVFVQLVGRKRFTLWTPSQHELMYAYPRVHPMWHKSRLNIRDPDLWSFPGFSQARAVEAELGPGDVLYVPPYTWHYVETLTPSVSLSTWSHDYQLYDHMNAIYKHDHKFDLIKSRKGDKFKSV